MPSSFAMSQKNQLTRKKRTRRKYRKRRKAKLYLPIGGFPSKMKVRLRYVSEESINAGVGLVGVHVFSANGLFDPDISGAGHQPSNFDVWIPGIYNHYTVTESKISVRVVPGATSINACYLGILVSDTGTRASAMAVDDILEQRKGRYAKYINVNANYQPRITHSFKASSFFGKTETSLINSSSYRGNSAANPTEGAFFEIYAASVQGNDPGEVPILVEVEYIAVLNEPKVNQSS